MNTIMGTIVTRREGQEAKETIVEGVRVWVYELEWLEKEKEGQGQERNWSRVREYPKV